MNVYVFGNPLIDGDSLALDVAKKVELEDVKFIPCITPDEALLADDDPLVILDVAAGIDEVSITEDVSRMRLRSSNTAHDLDLATMLKLEEAAGRKRRVVLVAVPQTGNLGKLAKEVKQALIQISKKE